MTIWELSRVQVAPHTVCSCSQHAGIVPKMLMQSARSWFGKIQRGTAHLGLICRVYHHNISLLTDFHWLLVSSKIEYKISCLSTCVNSNTSPPYPSDLCQLYLLLWTLHSYPSSGNGYIYIYNSLGSIYIGSVIWNNLLSHSIFLQLSVFEMWMQNISFIYLIKCLSVRTVISLPRHRGEAKTVKVVQRKINRLG